MNNISALIQHLLILILTSAFINALKSKVVFVNINALWTIKNKQWTTVFSLTNIYKV